MEGRIAEICRNPALLLSRTAECICVDQYLMSPGWRPATCRPKRSAEEATNLLTMQT